MKHKPQGANIPGRIFLDTSVVNFILDFGEEIHDGAVPPDNLNQRQRSDIDALYNMFLTGARAFWQLAISPQTYHEVMGTNNPMRRHWLDNWFFEIWEYWRGLVAQNDDLPTFIEAEDLRVKLLASDMLDELPDLADRILIVDAVVYRCDCFCTRDWKSILRHRDNLRGVGIPMLTPTEWWKMVEPYSGLWI